MRFFPALLGPKGAHLTAMVRFCNTLQEHTCLPFCHSFPPQQQARRHPRYFPAKQATGRLPRQTSGHHHYRGASVAPFAIEVAPTALYLQCTAPLRCKLPVLRANPALSQCNEVMQVQGPGSERSSQDAPGGAQQGQVSGEIVASMKENITNELQAEKVEIIDINGDGRHVSIDVIASAFEVRASRAPRALGAVVGLTGSTKKLDVSNTQARKSITGCAGCSLGRGLWCRASTASSGKGWSIKLFG